jgi:hypothetical protein
VNEVLFEVPQAPPALAEVATERHMLDLLHKRYGQQSYNGAVEADRYVRAEHVRASAGFDRRTADFVAFDTWASSKFAVHGVEVKVSRGDWLRELKDPTKAEPFMAWCTHWWLAVPDRSMVQPGELPGGWGLLAGQRYAGSTRLVAVFPAPCREVPPIPPASVAALLRAAVKTATRNLAP